MEKIEVLLEEIKEDKFRSKRGITNDHTLYEDCLYHFVGYKECLVNRKFDYDSGVLQEQGTGVLSVLQYQNLLLLERVSALESIVEDLLKEKQ